MVAVAVVARRRREIVALGERGVVDALLVIGELVGRQGGTVGKRLDFLAQEILRELNTLGSKSRDLASTREVLEMKAETEKIREQVQNIE